jgi:radical SAM protein with 4Fe4S-binding SPASM domain
MFRRRPRPRGFRAESFGGIVQLESPRALVFVDREYARGLGEDGGARWREGVDGEIGAVPLSAPLEAHLQLTNRCDAGCTGCYTAATPQGAAGEWGLPEWKRAIDALAAAGVFHLALGGGESAILPWLGEIAEYSREKGLVPNLTTSGLSGLDNLLGIAHLFGQINVSLDGVGETYAAVRGFDGFARADDALQKLRRVKKEIGVNCVVTRANFDRLGEVFAHAKKRRLNEVELLRFKPAGRASSATYADLVCSDAQHRAFLPDVLALTRRHRMRVRVDCSYTPMLAWHDPGADLLRQLAVYGCVGGDFLIGAKASGVMSACSFATPPPGKPRVDRIGEYWSSDGAFGAFRTWRDAAEPCRSCSYHALCRGGCKVVSAHVCHDAGAPDPECPKVVDHARSVGARRSASLRVV